MNDITVYTTSTCPYCTMLKNYLNSVGLPYREVNVQLDQNAAAKLVQATGQLGVPQTNINGHWVLGFDPDSIKLYVE
ncbi:glutaredoxin family protein [Rummeliibacillus sp. SL167]|uniref:glutaredoxin family protein n=1 Tax=Rummeliibacillus sp. SL167 TaxID=2579792 RepID=UPI0011B4AEF2|nr:glutaredoxin family protein [Rummeliibacillus sp. SL167]